MTNLKPCPFCGSENTDPAFSRGFDGGDRNKPNIAAGCFDCCAVGPQVSCPSFSVGAGYEESAAAWNTRSEPPRASAAAMKFGDLVELIKGTDQAGLIRHDGETKTVGDVNMKGGVCGCCCVVEDCDEIELLQIFALQPEPPVEGFEV
jgi:hypothetical protein